MNLIPINYQQNTRKYDFVNFKSKTGVTKKIIKTEVKQEHLASSGISENKFRRTLQFILTTLLSAIGIKTIANKDKQAMTNNIPAQKEPVQEVKEDDFHAKLKESGWMPEMAELFKLTENGTDIKIVDIQQKHETNDNHGALLHDTSVPRNITTTTWTLDDGSKITRTSNDFGYAVEERLTLNKPDGTAETYIFEDNDHYRDLKTFLEAHLTNHFEEIEVGDNCRKIVVPRGYLEDLFFC